MKLTNTLRQHNNQKRNLFTIYVISLLDKTRIETLFINTEINKYLNIEVLGDDKKNLVVLADDKKNSSEYYIG